MLPEVPCGQASSKLNLDQKVGSCNFSLTISTDTAFSTTCCTCTLSGWKKKEIDCQFKSITNLPLWSNVSVEPVGGHDRHRTAGMFTIQTAYGRSPPESLLFVKNHFRCMYRTICKLEALIFWLDLFSLPTYQYTVLYCLHEFQEKRPTSQYEGLALFVFYSLSKKSSCDSKFIAAGILPLLIGQPLELRRRKRMA